MEQPLMPDNGLDFSISSRALLKYALPTILSSIFMNVYSLVDSLFVANLVGIDAHSAVNIVGPALAVALAIGTMIATGGCALVSKQMGAGDLRGARENFSFFVIFSFCVSLVFCLAGLVFRRPLLRLMGADAALYPLCEAYAVPVFLIIPFAMIGMILQIFFVAAGAPEFGFGLSLAGGVLNIALDYVLIRIAEMGVAGAAVATGIGYSVQTVVGAAYFLFRRNGSLCFVRPKWNGAALLKAIFRAALKTIAVMSVLTFAAAFPAAEPLARVYASGSPHVMRLAVDGIRLFAAALLLMGFNMFASSMFTALNDGVTSAILSFLRTLAFLLIPLLLLPRLWGVNGVWLSMPAAEVLAILVSVWYFRAKRTVYHYA